LLKEAGFEDIAVEDRILRLEAGQPVQSFLVTARKPSVKAL
jgi:predicted TPR repeat methyltransferase